jgi:hypothetical protein
MSSFKKYGFLWVTSLLFLVSFAGHWALAWGTYAREQEAHQQPARTRDYVVQTARDTLENWQSEFLQLMWQVAGLAFLLHVGSPQSKEGDERKEEKIDEILRLLSKNKGPDIIKRLDKTHPRK